MDRSGGLDLQPMNNDGSMLLRELLISFQDGELLPREVLELSEWSAHM